MTTTAKSVNATIGELCELVNGRAFKPTEWTTSGRPIIRIQNLNDEKKEFNYFEGDYSEKHEVNDGDLLFSWSGTPGTSFGAFFWNRGRGVLNQHIFNVLIDKKRVEKRYFRYAINSRLNEIISHAHGGVGLQHITKGKLESVEIPLPPLSEQNRIADILDKADRIRRKRQVSAELIAECIPSLFSEMFGVIVTNTKKWPVIPFGEACDSRLGKMLDGKQQTGKHRRPYLRNTNVQWNQFSLNDVFEMDFDEADRKEFRLQNGDLLVCEGGEVGRAAIWRDELPECYFQKALHRVRPKSNIAVPEYVLHFLWQLGRHGGFQFLTSQATIAHLTGVKLKQLPMPLPPIELQREFAERLCDLEKAKEKYAEAKNETNQLFNTLVQRAFKGQL